MDVTLHLLDGMWDAIQQHLIPARAKFEEAGFIFAAANDDLAGLELHALEWYPVPPEGFDVRSAYFLQLTDETKAMVIKRAHDLGACLIEVHSHPFQTVAAFSPSDLLGFSEFVPHVRWRLKRRPYAAVVVAERSFDALAWAGEEIDGSPLKAIVADGKHLQPTRATISDDFHER
jgi:hypothetical protein